ncbi:MAG: tetratricopeptide repeat protein [Marinilabiliaceae bacterium]|nr:tetratricopeptide repeat protein [Marinilabiliaceae bacterium]
MSKIKKENTEDSFENVESALTKTEQFIENNQKRISAVVIAILIVVGGYYGIKKMHLQPKEKEAQESIFFAQEYFAVDSFQLALDGDGSRLGFLDIIDDYGFTDAGNLAKYYAGICYLNLGQFETAIDYLEDFSGEDQIISKIAIGAIGDAYVELGNKEEALKYYQDAAEGDNEFTAPVYLLKLGELQEELEMHEDALLSYNTIKNNFKNSNEGRQIEKYISRVEINLNK